MSKRFTKKLKIKNKISKKKKIMYKCTLIQAREQIFYREEGNEHGAYNQKEERIVIYELQFNYSFFMRGVLKEDQELPNLMVATVIILTKDKTIADRFTIGETYAYKDLPLN